MRVRRRRCDPCGRDRKRSRHRDDSGPEGGFRAVGGREPALGLQDCEGPELHPARVDLELEDSNDAFGMLLERAHRDLGAQEKVRETTTSRYLAMRYMGQTREVLVPIRSRTRRVTAISLRRALQEFHVIHKGLYSFKQPEHPTEVVDLRLELTGIRDALRIRSESLGDEDATVALTGTRAVYFHTLGGFVDTPIYAGSRSRQGTSSKVLR